MTPEDLLADWRSAFAELFPGRDADAMRYDDSTLALGLLLCRRMDQLAKVRVIEPAFAHGVEPQTTVRTRGKKRRSDE